MDPNNQNYQFNNAYQQMTTPPEPKKGLPKGIKIMIIVSVVFIILVSAIAVIAAIYQKKSSSTNTKTTTEEVAEEESTSTQEIEFKEIDTENLTLASIQIDSDEQWGAAVDDLNGVTKLVDSETKCEITTHYGDSVEVSNKAQKIGSQESIDYVISKTKESVTDFSSQQLGVKELDVTGSDIKKLSFLGEQLKYKGVDDIRYVVNVWARNLNTKDLVIYEACPEKIWNEQESSVLEKSSSIKVKLEFGESL